MNLKTISAISQNTQSLAGAPERKVEDRKGTLSGLLSSRKLAITLPAVITALSILGTIIPQESLCPLSDFEQWQLQYPFLSGLAISLGLTDLFRSAAFTAAAALLFLSISVCTYKRVRQALRNTGGEALDVGSFRQYGNSFSVHFPHSASGSSGIIQSRLLGRGYRPSQVHGGDGLLLKAEKGRFGGWGSFVFHFSFLIILAGALTSVWTRLEGRVVLTEGQQFQGYPNEYLFVRGAPFADPEPLGFRLTLERFKPAYGTPSRYVSEVLIEGSGEKRSETIRDFHALSHHGYTFYQKDHGFSPQFLLQDSRGRVVFESFVAVKSHLDGEGPRYEDHFKIPGTDLEVEARLYPDAAADGEKITTRSPMPDNPLIDLTIKRAGEAIYDGRIRLNECVGAGDLFFCFSDLRYWSAFRVVKDAGIPIIYAGFFVGILGLLVRLLLVRERIWVIIEEKTDGSMVTVAGWTERGKAFFAERFAGLVEELKKEA